MKEITQRLILLGGSIVIGLIGVEVIVRLIEPREVMRYFFMSSDPILHHKFIPHAHGHYKTTEFDVEYAINSRGLRERELSVQKSPGTRRVLLLGDSFTEGDGVEIDETFAHQLQTMVDQLPTAERWELINAGVGSYSSLLEYLYLVHDGLALKPDLVILNFDLSDVYDDIQYTQTATFDGSGRPLKASPEVEAPPGGWAMSALVSVKDFLKDHTRLYNFVRIRIDRYLEGARHTNDPRGNIQYDKYAMLRDTYRPDAQDWSLTHRYLLMIRDTLQSRGIPLWVAVYPYGLQVSRREWDAGRVFWGFRQDTVYGTRPQEDIVAFCTKNRIPAINTCDAFLKAAESTYPLYLDYNGHWRPAGHTVFARALFAHLRQYIDGMHLRSDLAAPVGTLRERTFAERRRMATRERP